jgi:hypothetical protein
MQNRFIVQHDPAPYNHCRSEECTEGRATGSLLDRIVRPTIVLRNREQPVEIK